MIKDTKIVMGICLSRRLKETIDKTRGDVPRSKYISKILEREMICQKEIEDGNYDVRQRQSKSRDHPPPSSGNSSQPFHPKIPEVGVVNG